MERPIYLDNNSTTPLDPAVLEAMLPYFTKHFGNPSNPSHFYGSEAADAVERSRGQVASLIGAKSKEIIFTSGATESNNLAILGAARRDRERRDHLVTVVTEHKAVLGPCRKLEAEGFRVTYLRVDHSGSVDSGDVDRAITSRTTLVSVMMANNEVGTLQPVIEIGQICKKRGVLFHSDAVQAIGKVPIDVDQVGVDLLSVSAHKLYGPKGVGALYVRSIAPKVQLDPICYGGGQENGLRSGTIPVPNVVGLGSACEVARLNLPTEPMRLITLRNRLQENLHNVCSDVCRHGPESECLPGLLNVGFPTVDGDALIHALKGLAVSQGSSCSAGSFEPSHVLRAMGVTDELARASIRFGIGRFNTAEEMDKAAELVAEALMRLVGTGH